MVKLEDIIDLVKGMVADATGPLPGFFTVTTVARLMLSTGLLNEKESSEEPSSRQRQYIQRLIINNPDIFEMKRIRGKSYFRLRDE